ncbi:hypothetical protein BC829DRAFT_417321 [Chytridium lagenaria]|nr:hypothetical protein BC829DRAFT_417321 [Chytridium lagenaria]
MASQDFTGHFETGDINMYPFDRYAATSLFITGEFINPGTNVTLPVPIAFTFTAPVLTYAVRADKVKDLSGDVLGGFFIQLDFNVMRSVTTIFFFDLGDDHHVGIIASRIHCGDYGLVEKEESGAGFDWVFHVVNVISNEVSDEEANSIVVSMLIFNYILRYNFDIPAVKLPKPNVVEKEQEKPEQPVPTSSLLVSPKPKAA